jgi:hypothetical protein
MACPAQILTEPELPKMKFPKVIRHRKAEVTICGKKSNLISRWFRPARFPASPFQ